MCVILYAPPKKEIKEKFLRNAFKNNADGAGIMYYDWKGNVNFQKGFMNYDEMKKFWDGLDDRLARAVHCRIATSGEVVPKNCHPFKIHNNIKELHRLQGISKTGCVMHNGILADYSPKEGLNSLYSDTMAFTQQVLFPLVKGKCIENDGVKKLINDLGNVFLLFMPNFKVIMFGDWLTDKDGFFASNESYLEKNNYFIPEFGCDEMFLYNKGFVDEILPRYTYEFQFKYDGDEFPYFIIDDLIDDLGEFIICADQPYCTLIKEGDGLYSVEIDLYDCVDGMLPSSFLIKTCVLHTKEKNIVLS